MFHLAFSRLFSVRLQLRVFSKNYSSDLHESLDKKLIKFSKSSASGSGSGNFSEFFNIAIEEGQFCTIWPMPVVPNKLWKSFR